MATGEEYLCQGVDLKTNGMDDIFLLNSWNVNHICEVVKENVMV